jgi:hypothetical protein
MHNGLFNKNNQEDIVFDGSLLIPLLHFALNERSEGVAPGADAGWAARRGRLKARRWGGRALAQDGEPREIFLHDQIVYSTARVPAARGFDQRGADERDLGGPGVRRARTHR